MILSGENLYLLAVITITGDCAAWPEYVAASSEIAAPNANAVIFLIDVIEGTSSRCAFDHLLHSGNAGKFAARQFHVGHI
jgi:hypothetical protein